MKTKSIFDESHQGSIPGHILFINPIYSWKSRIKLLNRRGQAVVPRHELQDSDISPD